MDGKKSVVWKYFIKNDDETKTICQLCNASLNFKGMHLLFWGDKFLNFYFWISQYFDLGIFPELKQIFKLFHRPQHINHADPHTVPTSQY